MSPNRDFVVTPTPPFTPDPLALTVLLRRLAACARTSPDRSTQNAALAIHAAELCYPDPEHDEPQCNRPLYPDPRCDTDRELKMALTVHAEEAVATVGYSDLVALWAACPGCARAIVRTGFSRMWTLDMPCPDRWKRSVELGREILTRCGVAVHVIRPRFELGESWLHDGAEYHL